MNDPVEHQTVLNTNAHGREPGAYEAPCIERVLTPDEMEREVMFAGPGFTLGDGALPEPG